MRSLKISVPFWSQQGLAVGGLLFVLIQVPTLIYAELAPPSITSAYSKNSATKLDDALILRLCAEAQKSHPTVAAARARLEAAGAGVRSVRLWEDPELRTSFAGARQQMRKDNGDLGLGLEVSLPRTSLYSAMKSKASAEQRAQTADVMAAQTMLGVETAKAAVELALADEALGIEAQQVEWVKQMAVNAQERAKDPKASTAEALRIESEFLQERQRQSALQQERELRARQLNLLLSRPVAQPWPSLTLPGTGSVPDMKVLMLQLSSANPRLEALRQTATAAEAESAMARLERHPKFALSIDTSTYSGGDLREAIVGVKMSLPWLNDRVYRATADRASALASAVQQDRVAAERELQAQVIAASKEARTTAQQAKVYGEQIIPAAAAAVEAVTTAWISSNSTLLEVLEARRSLLTVQLEERRFVAANRVAIETIRALVPESKR